MAKFTPGPWYRNIAPAKKYVTVWSGRNKHVCYLDGQHMTDEEAEANINLIAAAPELLEACYEALQGQPDYDVIRAAIARAEGLS